MPNDQTTSGADSVRLIAFYLTQFHPIPENDRWWGKGFTEWTNVTKSLPLFKGHYQPHLPTDLGFYDLRLRETRHEQIALAKSYGIDGFCYYFYWFSGHKLLEAPLEDMLADPESDMPFCLCWANENWTRRWDGAEHEILIEQHYRPEDDLGFIKSLEPYLKDPRYIKVDGAPLIIVYRPQHMPDSAKSIAVWRAYCATVGIGKIHLACALTHGNWDHRKYGFDFGVEFPPHNLQAHNLAPQLDFQAKYSGFCPDYSEGAEAYLQRQHAAEDNVFRGVFPSWDNSARRGIIGTAVLNGTPENYQHWLGSTIAKTRAEHPGGDRLVFVNAWNEWAEGCHLEPDRKYGHRFLEATASAKAGRTSGTWVHAGAKGDYFAGPNAGRNFLPPVSNKSLLSRAFRSVRDLLTLRKLRKRQK